MIKPLPKIEPFINCVTALRVGDYLKSNEFKRYCIKSNIADVWSAAYDKAKETRDYYSPDVDHNYYDSVSALIILLNAFWVNNKAHFYGFSTDLLVLYSEWSNQIIDMKEINDDLVLLNFPQEHINILLQLNFKGVPKINVPEEIWNSNKLNDYLRKMDNSINSKEYKLTLTYAYTCLEGLYKSYIKQKEIKLSKETDSVTRLAVLVRDHLKEDFKLNKIDFPNQMLNLISTITNSIADARNSYSMSHFDKDSDKCLAEFSRDSVNSIGRMILNFI